MSLEAFSPSRRRHHTPMDTLAEQLETLRREAQHLRKELAHHAGDTASDLTDIAHDVGREAAKQGAYLAGIASRKAARGAKAIQRDPLPAIAVVGTVLLVASFFAGRNR